MNIRKANATVRNARNGKKKHTFYVIPVKNTKSVTVATYAFVEKKNVRKSPFVSRKKNVTNLRRNVASHSSILL